MAKAPKKEVAEAGEPPVELEPDAWERFEAAVDKMVKAPPAHGGKAGRIKDESCRKRVSRV